MLKIKLVDPNAYMPVRANETDAGADLISPVTRVLPANRYVFIDLGFQMELPKGTAGFIYARSGLGTKHGITPRNCVGVIDEKYRGNVGVILENNSNHDYFINAGDRIAQLVITPVMTPELVQVEELDMTDDRQGGFGHTGK